MPQNKLKRDAHLGNPNGLPGFPGYRTRRGRSGYDPLDTNREAAFMEGTFYRNLFTLRLKTRNVFYLTLMFISGISLTAFFSIALYATIFTPLVTEPDLITYLYRVVFCFFLGLFWLVGILLLVNLLINLRMILSARKSELESANNMEQNTKEDKKKLPKRRKDFR